MSELISAEYLNSIRDVLDKDRDLADDTPHTSDSLVNNWNNHIGKLGTDIHKVATRKTNVSSGSDGFMTPADYAIYQQLLEEYAELEELLEDTDLPSGTCVWYYKDTDMPPDGWEFVNDVEDCVYNAASKVSAGAAIHGTLTDSGSIGTVSTFTGQYDYDDYMKTIALHLIRKK